MRRLYDIRAEGMPRGHQLTDEKVDEIQVIHYIAAKNVDCKGVQLLRSNRPVQKCQGVSAIQLKQLNVLALY